MAEAKTTTPPDGTAPMPTQPEMALAHSKTQDTNLTNETIDEKGNTSPRNSITDDHPQKSKRSFMTLNFWICFAISLGQIAFGYPASIIATTLGQPAFLLYMGLVKEDGSMGGNANALIGATSGVFQVRERKDTTFQFHPFLGQTKHVQPPGYSSSLYTSILIFAFVVIISLPSITTKTQLTSPPSRQEPSSASSSTPG